TGDGASYGEGGNHFLHNIRRNVDITHFIHDNQIYGLTKGQASPTTAEGQITGVQVTGSINTPLNPILLAIAAGAGFVARSFSGDRDHLKQIMKEAISYKGYAMVDILQPCVTYNKINTFAYYKNRVYQLDADYDPTDRLEAMKRAMEFDERIPIGVIYKEEKEDFHKKNIVLAGKEPLLDQKTDMKVIQSLIQEFV
ncbi:MAG TPA: 2-oxoacid ferredoxin oxidoreductase, partial [Lachnospiraceae bacterium]|nr:2-oxoacid ferredoxin oxidoreductase [Lachnospiraceae bacterium]